MSRVPLFWMNEESGKMRAVVHKFLNELTLDEKELNLLRWYIIQWIDGTINQVTILGGAALIPPGYKEKINSYNQKQLFEYVAGDLLKYSYDPF